LGEGGACENGKAGSGESESTLTKHVESLSND
jgi:hypothetical protein